MTEEHKASRTIVKSPPELWAECSVAQTLARHLGEFGEIRITRLEPETTVAWEGEHACGTVRLEPSGWGTQVTLTATPTGVAVSEPAVDPEPAPAEVEPVLAQPEPVPVEPEPLPVEPEPVPVEREPVPMEPEPVPVEPEPVDEAEVVEEAEEPHDAEKSDEDIREHAREHLPRWQVFARLWARLGRKPREHHDEAADDRASDDEPEAFDAIEEVEPVEDAREPVAEGAEPVEEAVGDAPGPAAQLDHQALLVDALDSLGQAHHRPFSRA